MKEIPAGARVRYVTNRHWWEVVEEAIDAVWYAGTIVTFVWLALSFTQWKSMLWGLFFILLPAAHFSAELVRWGFVSYAIIDGEDGGTFVRKMDRKFQPLRGNPYKVTEPAMKFETLETKGNVFTKYIGFESIFLKIGDAAIFSGERVPLEFAKKMREKKPERKPVDEGAENVLARSIGDWFNIGIIDRSEARAMAIDLFQGVGRT